MDRSVYPVAICGYLAVVGFLVACCLIAIQVRLEEATLLRVHGLGYRAYASRVGRFVPFIGRLADDEDAAGRRWTERGAGPELPSCAPRHGGDQWS